MGVVMDDRAARDRVARIEVLLEQVDTLPAAGRDVANELVQTLLDLYGEGLGRIVAVLAEHDDDGELAAALSADEVVSHLLLLHGLHPVPLQTRVLGALEEVRPYLESHGGDVELLGIADGVARLRLKGSCSGCPSSTVTLKLAVEDAIHKVAPDLERIEAEGAAEPAPASGLIQLGISDALGGRPEPAIDGSWANAGDVAALGVEGPVVKDIAGEPVLFVRLGRSAYAYRPDCPGCEGALAAGRLLGARLTCPGCGRRYDVHRAGRCLDAAELHLTPVPLLMAAGGQIKVALGAAA
jgi:Fe-S cluster biogenesis protein NfuA/nitrite reductase/ring-hydroxylating ferredoxin subunit